MRRRRVETELHEELDFHILMQARKHEAAGMSADEALRAARLERVLASAIQNVPMLDVVALAGGFSTAVVACLVAALIPSLRAARVDPTVALRRD